MKRRILVIAGVALMALLVGTLLNPLAFGGSNPILDAIMKALQGFESRLDGLNATVTEQQQQISELQSKLESLNNTLTSQIEALELNQSALAERIAMLEDAVFGSEGVTFLYDRFDTGLDNWNYWEEFYNYGYSSYTLQWASNAAMINGDGFCVRGGMQKVVELLEWNESEALLLSFDWRATSGVSSSMVTNAILRIQDADSNSSLYSQDLVLGGTTDTGWRSYVNDISSYVQGHSRIRIILYLEDGWGANWNQTNAYDNIRITQA